MAIFNPQVPQGKDEMPSWVKVTNPISSFEGDKSTGIALASLGQGIDSAAGIVETTAKDIINKDVRSTVEPIREDYTQQLLATKAIIQGAGSAVPPMDLMNGNQANSIGGQSVPAGIDAGLRKVDRIENMMKLGSGKLGVDDTYYDMRMKTAVTDLRARYPGFVDYIDSRVSNITGMNPANELVNDLTRQISQLQTTKKTEFDKTMDLARKAMGDGLQGAKEMKDYLANNGEKGVSVWEDWYYKQNRNRAIFEEQDRARKAQEGDKKDNKEKRTANYTMEVAGGIAAAMDTFVSITGVSDQKKLLDFIQDAANNPGKYKEEQMQQLATKFMAQKADLYTQYTLRASKIDHDDKGRPYSYDSDITAEGTRSVRDNLFTVYDNIEKALLNKDAGLAFSLANAAKGMIATDTHKIYSGPMGADMRLINIMYNQMGPNWTSAVNTQIVKNAVDTGMSQLFTNNVLAAKAGQPSPETGNPVTFKSMADGALDKQKSGQINERMRARYLESGLNVFIEDITDQNSERTPIQAKLNAMRFFFSPNGQDVLQHFANDKYDYSTNPPTIKPGRQTVWNKLTSEAVVSQVKELSKIDPSIGNMYRQWTEREAGAQLYIKELKALNGFTGTDDVHIKYDDGEKSGHPSITLIDKSGAPLKTLGQEATSRRYYTHMQETVGRINEALIGMDRVHKGLGVGNASDALLSFMHNSQVDLGKLQGLPKQLMEAIAASRGQGKLKDVMEK